MLDSGTPTRLGMWVVVAAIAVLALLGWQLRTPQVPPEVTDTPVVAAPEPPGEPAAEPLPAEWGVDNVAEVTFVDDLNGFAVLQRCSSAVRWCGRRLLTTTDAGATWEAVRWLPTMADGYNRLMAPSFDELMLLDVDTLADVVRSTDGGRSWVRLPVERADPLPLAAAGVLVLGGPVICNRDCEPTTVSWFDPATLLLHPLPTQPSAEELARSQSTTASRVDGDIVVGGTTLTGAYVAFSRDSGRTWSQTRLNPELGTGHAVMHADVRAAGGGRAYAFVQIDDGIGGPSTLGYRSDDGGASWLPLPLQRQPFVWPPQALLEGELLVTDLSGHLYLSISGGTSWAEVESPGDLWITQNAPGETIVGTVWGAEAVQTQYFSRDGHTWVPMRLPD